MGNFGEPSQDPPDDGAAGDDLLYCLHRASIERAHEIAATDPRAAAVHREMAELYTSRVRALALQYRSMSALDRPPAIGRLTRLEPSPRLRVFVSIPGFHEVRLENF